VLVDPLYSAQESVAGLLLVSNFVAPQYGLRKLIASLKKYFRHHPLVLVAQQMTVEKRYSPDDGVGEVHHQIGASFDGYLHRIQPLRTWETRPVLGIGEKVNLMNVEGVHFVRVIDHSLVVKSAETQCS
jgi:hypothetical protein